jgi:hypothetical protein
MSQILAFKSIFLLWKVTVNTKKSLGNANLVHFKNIFFYSEKKCEYKKKGIGIAHLALCGTFF